MEELVFKTNKGTAVTDSLLVASKFGKEHKNVIQAIENLIAENSAVKNMFYKTTYPVRGREFPKYIMNRDGFSLLVMGFTGSDAIQFKIDFINAFNKMEKALSLPDFTNPAEAAIAWAEQYKQKELAEAKIKQLEPKASYADRVLEHDNQLVDIGQAAKLLKLPFGRNKFFARLRQDGIFFKNRNEPKQEYIDRGYFDIRKAEIERTEHPGFTVLKVLVMPSGLFWLSKKYGGNYNTNLPTLSLQ